MIAFFKDNPQMLAFMLICAISVFNWVTKPRTPEELSILPPRVAAFFRFMNGLFPDPEKVTEAIWQAWNNTHGRLPSKTSMRPPPPDDSNE